MDTTPAQAELGRGTLLFLHLHPHEVRRYGLLRFQLRGMLPDLSTLSSGIEEVPGWPTSRREMTHSEL